LRSRGRSYQSKNHKRINGKARGYRSPQEEISEPRDSTSPPASNERHDRRHRCDWRDKEEPQHEKLGDAQGWPDGKLPVNREGNEEQGESEQSRRTES